MSEAIVWSAQPLKATLDLMCSELKLTTNFGYNEPGAAPTSKFNLKPKG